MKYIYPIITMLFICSCNWTLDEDGLKEELHRTTTYDDGVVREGLYRNNIPVGIHKYYNQNTLKKLVNYIEWDTSIRKFSNQSYKASTSHYTRSLGSI